MDNRNSRRRHTPSDPRSRDRNVIDGRPVPRRRSSDLGSSTADGYFDRSRISADDAARVSRNASQKESSYESSNQAPRNARQMPEWAQHATGSSRQSSYSQQASGRFEQARNSSRRTRQHVGQFSEPFSEESQNDDQFRTSQNQHSGQYQRRQNRSNQNEEVSEYRTSSSRRESLQNQPSWYDPNRAESSRTPRATLDTSLENPRWYSRNENDVYVGGRRSFGGNGGERGGTYNRTAFHASGSHGRSKLPFIIGGGVIVLILLIVLIVNVVGALTAPQQTQQDDTLAVSEEAPTSTSLTISFAGDCTLGTDSSFDPSTSFNAVYDDADDPAYFMKNVASIFGSDDYTIVNMEGTLTESESRQDKTFAFKGPAEYTEILKSGNIEAASLANNHSHDYGDQSYDDTIAALDDAGIVNFGYDRIAYADVKGVKVAMIGTYMLAEGLDIKDEMVANINAAKNEGAQIIIVFTHWGIEKETVPGADQVELGHAAINAGATIVVGSHPHVIQGYEKYNGRYIVYSLGNFCFGGNKNPSDKDCMIFQQTFTVTGNDVATDDSINVIPCSISSSSSSNNYQPTPAEGDEADRIMAKIEESNSSIASISADVSGTTNDSESSESTTSDETSNNTSSESNG